MTSETKFKRARNKENKKIRFQQIKEAALCLFDAMPYHEISLSKIGEVINFTRANLYKYVTSKEDIYLFILLDEISETVDELSKKLIGDKPIAAQEFTEEWTDTIMEHPRFLRLFSFLYLIIEQNSDIDALVDFKNKLIPVTEKVVKIIRHNFPELSYTEAIKVIDHAMALIISRYPICYPTEKQISAVEKSDYDYIFPDFRKTYSEGMLFILNGLKLTKP